VKARTAFLILFATVLTGSAAEDATMPAPSFAPTLQAAGLHNAFRVTDRIYSGSQPEKDGAFAELARLGVKTIISVDGAKPDVETARKYGLRYVHLPFGYDGPSAERTAQLAQAASTISGPIFIHCHHGKHRGPAAVGILCVTSEGWTPDRAEAWLRQAGTAADYPGLYRSVREFRPIAAAQLSRLGPLPELWKSEAIVDAMVAIDALFDSLLAMGKAGWKTPPGHAALSPAHEATLLWEHLRELARTDDTAKRPDDYRTKLADSERAADTLRTALRTPVPDRAAIDAAFHQSSQSCAACHKTFRNL